MRQFSKSLFFLIIFGGNMLITLADRGIGKKAKSRITLNIPTNNSFKNAVSFNLKTGLKYKGSLLREMKQENNSFVSTNLVTYQKGNTIYIIPNKQKIIVPEIKQGYTGVKLIIKSN